MQILSFYREFSIRDMIGADSEMMRKRKLRVSNWVHLRPRATIPTPYVRSLILQTYPLNTNLWKKQWISSTFIPGRKSLEIILSRGWTRDFCWDTIIFVI